MKFYGRKKEEKSEDDLLELEEVSICASPERLRQMARFILDCADSIELRTPDFWDHEHFADHIELEDERPDFIIVNPQKYA